MGNAGPVSKQVSGRVGFGVRIKALLLGDLFITNELIEERMRAAFDDTDMQFDFVSRTDEWPVKPVERNDEVREFVGGDEDILPLIADADVVLTHTACMTRRVIEAGSSLRAVAAARGGPTNINVQACTDHGIPVFYAPGRNAGAVAEFSVGMMLAVTRNIPKAHDSLRRDRRWRGELCVLSGVGNELSRSVIGLVGLGAIGRKVAHIVRAFGARVIAYDPFVTKEQLGDLECELVEFDEVFRQADIVSVHARYTKENAGMIGARQIGLMKSTAYFVNTARGELVDNTALYRAVESGAIAGAGLDVFEGEPPPEGSPAYTLDNIVASTHLAGASRQAAEIGIEVAVGELKKFLTGSETPRFCVNAETLG